MADHLDLSKAPWHGRRPENQFYGYYISFDATGNEAVDDVLRAVAVAAKGYHNTEGWGESIGGDPSYLDWIQAAANAAAADNAALRERVASRDTVLDAIVDALHAAGCSGAGVQEHVGDAILTMDALRERVAKLERVARRMLAAVDAMDGFVCQAEDLLVLAGPAEEFHAATGELRAALDDAKDDASRPHKLSCDRREPCSCGVSKEAR